MKPHLEFIETLQNRGGLVGLGSLGMLRRCPLRLQEGGGHYPRPD